jgi:hypothetical protein
MRDNQYKGTSMDDSVQENKKKKIQPGLWIYVCFLFYRM